MSLETTTSFLVIDVVVFIVWNVRDSMKANTKQSNPTVTPSTGTVSSVL